MIVGFGGPAGVDGLFGRLTVVGRGAAAVGAGEDAHGGAQKPDSMVSATVVSSVMA